MRLADSMLKAAAAYEKSVPALVKALENCDVHIDAPDDPVRYLHLPTMIIKDIYLSQCDHTLERCRNFLRLARQL